MTRLRPMLATLAITSVAAGGSLDEALSLLPQGDVHGIAAVTQLKRTSLEIQTLLEGMDRADMLLGVRPVDQLKSALGITSSVDDGGAAVLAVIEAAGGPDAIFIIPVTDDDSFLNDNFRRDAENEAYLTRDGATVWARSFDEFVVLSTQHPLDEYQPRGDTEWLAECVPGGAAAMAADDLGVLVLDAKGITRSARLLLADEAELPIGDPLQDPVVQRVLWWFQAFEGGDASSFLMTFDFDPLALIIRSRLTLSSLDDLPEPPAPRGRAFDRLPAGDYMMAVSADLQAWRRPQLRGLLERWQAIPGVAAWIDGGGDRAQFAVYPSPAGLKGGLLNESLTFVETGDPAASALMFRRHLATLAENETLASFQLHWDDAYEIESVGPVASYELEAEHWTDAAVPTWSTAFTTAFGPMGWRGYVAPADDAMLVTFSHRPKLVQRALEHARNPGRVLADDAAIRSMRTWIPAQAELQVFTRLGPAGTLLEDLPLPIPVRIERGLPPIGFALWTKRGGIETATVCPAPVLAAILDEAGRMQAIFEAAGGGAAGPGR